MKAVEVLAEENFARNQGNCERLARALRNVLPGREKDLKSLPELESLLEAEEP